MSSMKVGGVVTYRNDHSAKITKTGPIATLIPEKISECALYLGRSVDEPCMDTSTLHSIADSLHGSGRIGSGPATKNDKELLNHVEQELGCDTERCVLTKMTHLLGEERVRKEINTFLKVRGPTNTKLLSNVNIDSTLRQWAVKYTDFFPYNFNMLNYASYSYDGGYILHQPDTLATILFTDLYTGARGGKQYRCAGCVINTDRYQGDGKHWMALFADTRDPARWTIEFFNSSGNAPAPEYVSWLVKTRDGLEQLAEGLGKAKPAVIEIVRATTIRHQQSRTECGLYSLFYIWARLNKVPVEFFIQTPISDQLMFEFRQHLFDDPSRQSMKTFDWNEYRATVKIEWE